MLEGTFKSLAYSLDTQAIANLLNTSMRSAQRWLTTGKAPQWAIAALYGWRYGIPVTADKAWHGFEFRGGLLWTPEDVPVTPGDIQAIPYLMALNRELKHKVAQPQQWRLL